MLKVKLLKNLLLLLLFIVFPTIFILIQKADVKFVDEGLHFEQTYRIIFGDFSQNPNLMMFPGFHLFMSLISYLFQSTSYLFLRTVSFSINLLMLYVFFRLASIIDRKNAFGKTFLLSFLPVLFYCLFLFYTDGFSLFTVILAYYLGLNKKYFYSGLMGTYSLFIRQNNLFIILLIYFLIYIQNNGWKINLTKITKYLKSLRVFVIGMILFAVCVFLSEKAAGNNDVRNTVRLSISSFANVYFFFFISFWLFLPLHLANLRKILRLLREKKIIFLIISGFCLFLVSFIPEHPYNQSTWFLHNSIFLYFSADLTRKIIFFLFALTAALSFGVTKLIKKEYYLLYPITILYLLPHKMVEFRYSIIPLAMFILFMKKSRGAGMVLINIIFIGISLFLMWGMLTVTFFP